MKSTFACVKDQIKLLIFKKWTLFGKGLKRFELQVEQYGVFQEDSVDSLKSFIHNDEPTALHSESCAFKHDNDEDDYDDIVITY